MCHLLQVRTAKRLPDHIQPPFSVGPYGRPSCALGQLSVSIMLPNPPVARQANDRVREAVGVLRRPDGVEQRPVKPPAASWVVTIGTPYWIASTVFNFTPAPKRVGEITTRTWL